MLFLSIFDPKSIEDYGIWPGLFSYCLKLHSVLVYQLPYKCIPQSCIQFDNNICVNLQKKNVVLICYMYN